jgi:PAS domain S-box-containing protein
MNEISELKKRVEELEKANREFRDIFNAVDDLIFVVDRNNVITRVNSACASFLKVNPQDIIGRKCHELMHKLGRPWAECPLDKTKRDEKTHVEEINDPNIGVALLVTTSPIFNEKGEMSGAVHTAKNITGHKKQEAALSESETKYRAIFDTSADAIMLVAPEKGFIAGNAAALKLFKCKDIEGLLSRSPADLSPEYQPDGRPSLIKAQEMMRIALENGSNFFEWTHRRVNQEEFFATVLLTRMKLGARIILQATVRDITERILSEKQLAKKLRDFEIFYNAAVDREMKIKELKKKIQELEAKIRG